jgi:hypothetical protein
MYGWRRKNAINGEITKWVRSLAIYGVFVPEPDDRSTDLMSAIFGRTPLDTATLLGVASS